uniref:Fibronectin type-III domain-containing protein n=1 Tax=Gongylonema pulchrum TaxID=637853 RepID=A0A183D9S6_9BILA
LQPGTEYEVAVKVMMPGGMESAWSLREIVRTSPYVLPMQQQSDSFELRCSFEEATQCAFESDPLAPLQWTRIRSDSYAKHRTVGHSKGEYFISLQSTAMDENYGRLISTPFTFVGDPNYCLSVWMHITEHSKGWCQSRSMECFATVFHKNCIPQLSQESQTRLRDSLYK